MILLDTRPDADAPPLTTVQLFGNRPDLRGVSVVGDALAGRWTG
jgi:hypothetical protein